MTKTRGLAAGLLTLLFLTTESEKIVVIINNDDKVNKLELLKSYFVKNLTHKIGNIFEATDESTLTLSKKDLNHQNRFRILIYITIIMSHFKNSTFVVKYFTLVSINTFLYV